MMALQTVAITMLNRNRTIISVISVFFALIGILFMATKVRELPVSVLLPVGLIGMFAYLIIFGIFIFQDAEVGTKGSSFPIYLYSLPIRTSKLVLVPMACGTLAVLGTGVFLSWAARQGGLDFPLFWPSFLAATFLAMLQAIFWFPIGFSYSKLILTLLGIPFIVLLIVAPISEGMSQTTICGGLSAVTSGFYFIAYVGVSRARLGEGQLVRIVRSESEAAKSSTKPVRWLKPFANSQSAQRWYEWRQHGIIMPTLVLCLFGLFWIPLPWNDTYSPVWMLSKDGVSVIPTVPTYVATYFPTMLGLIPLIAWIVGCGARRSDVKHSDRTLHLFFGVRPMSDGGMVAQKLWTALKSCVMAWGILLAFFVLLLQLKGGHYAPPEGYVREEPMPIFTVLQPYLTTQVLLILAGGLLLLVAATWRNYVVGYWVELSGIPWLNIIYPFVVIFLVIISGVIPSVVPRGFQQRWLTPEHLNEAIWAVVALKLVIAAVLTYRALGARTITLPTLARAIAGYAAIVGSLVAVALAITVPLREAMREYSLVPLATTSGILIGMIVLWTPIVRILLAPMMLSRNRHRAG